MRIPTRLTLLLFLSSLVAVGQTESEGAPRTKYRLGYDSPSSAWDNALFECNGRLGSIVFGETAHERLQFKEEILWSGGPDDSTADGASWALPEIQRLLFEGDGPKAHDLFGRSMTGVCFEQMKYQAIIYSTLRSALSFTSSRPVRIQTTDQVLHPTNGLITRETGAGGLIQVEFITERSFTKEYITVH